MTRQKMNRPMLEANQKGGGALIPFHREQLSAIAAMGKPPKKNGQDRAPVHAAEDILGEAMRWEGPEGDPNRYVRHLVKQKLTPTPPMVSLYGLAPDKVRGWYDREHRPKAAEHLVAQRFWKEGAWEGRRVTFKPKDDKAYRLPVEGAYTLLKPQPTNVPTIIASVHSYPGPANDKDQKYLRWKRKVVRAVLKHYRHQNVVCIVEHTDEKHGHIHAIVALPDAGPIAGMMATKACRDAAEARGEPAKDLGKWYRKGGKRLQDFFFRMVGWHMGWKRGGVQSYFRMSNEEVKIRRQLAGEVAEHEANISAQRAEVGSDRTRIEAREVRVGLAIGEMNAMQLAWHSEAVRREAEIEERERKVQMREKEAEELHTDRMREIEAERLRRIVEDERINKLAQDTVDLRNAHAASHALAEARLGSAAAAHRQMLAIVMDAQKKGQLTAGEYQDLTDALHVSARLIAAHKRRGKADASM